MTQIHRRTKTRMASLALLAAIGALGLLLCDASAVTAAAAAAEPRGAIVAPAFPAPAFTPDTTPMLQWSLTFNQSFSSWTGLDGKGLFFASGLNVGRRRAVNGRDTWTHDAAQRSAGASAIIGGLLGNSRSARSLRAAVGTNSTCSSPFTPDLDANHLYIVCSPNHVVKMWYDTGVVQWSVAVSIPSDPLPQLNRISGLSYAFTPAPALLVTSTTEGAAPGARLFVLDSRTGALLSHFGGSDLPPFAPAPADPFVYFRNLDVQIVSPTSAPDQVTVVSWVQLASSGLAQQLVLFRFSLLNASFAQPWSYHTLLNRPTSLLPQNYYSSYSLPSQRLYLRVDGGATGDPNLFLVDGSASVWNATVDPSAFPLRTALIDSTDAQARYVCPAILQSSARTGGALLLPLLDTTAPSGSPAGSAVQSLDFSGVLGIASNFPRPFHVLWNPSAAADATGSMQMVLVGPSRLSAVRLHLSPSPVPITPPLPKLTLDWSFTLFETWSDMDGDGAPIGSASIQSFASLAALNKIVSVRLLPDMQSASSLLLVHTNSTAPDPDSGAWLVSESLWAFTTHASLSCNASWAGNCTGCESSTGVFTARTCAYCPASGSCLDIGASAIDASCADPTFGSSVSICSPAPPPPGREALSTLGLVCILLAVVALAVCAVVGLVRRSNRHTRHSQPDHSLKDTYHTLSPNLFSEALPERRSASPDAMRSASPRKQQRGDRVPSPSHQRLATPDPLYE